MEYRIFILAELHVILTEFCDLNGVIDRFFVLAKVLFHFLSGFEKKLIFGEFQPFWIINRFTRLNT